MGALLELGWGFGGFTRDWVGAFLAMGWGSLLKTGWGGGIAC